MKALSVADAEKKIRAYLARDNLRPYFVIADGAAECAELGKIFDDLARIDVEFRAEIAPLDTDMFVESLDALTRAAIVFGLGERLFLTGRENFLRALYDSSFDKKVILVCRGVSNFLERLADEDSKFRLNRICRVVGSADFAVEPPDAADNPPLEQPDKKIPAPLKDLDDGFDFFD